MELVRKEVMDLKRSVNEERHEKEASQKTSNELRNMVKKIEADKTDLSRCVQDCNQKIGGTSPRSHSSS